MLFKLELTPGGVDNNRSGTTGEGDVIEFKLDSVVVDEEHEEGEGAIAIPVQGSPVADVVEADGCSVSMTMLPLAGSSVGDSSSSNMQIGGCAGI